MSEFWCKERCPHCQTINWVCDSGGDDLSAIDIEAIKCRQCGGFFWFGFMDEMTMEICGYTSPEDAMFYEEGKEAPD